MASTQITLKDLADNSIVYHQIGSSASGASYRDTTRALSTPRTLDFDTKIGNPGSKGNDKVKVVLRDSVQNSGSGLTSTASAVLEISIPRDSAWTSAMTADLIAQLQELVKDANAQILASALIP